MKNHPVVVYPSKEHLNREDQPAWKITSAAVDVAPVDLKPTDMVINRIIDNTSVAKAAANRGAKAQALAYPREKGARFLGCNANISSAGRLHRKFQTLSEGILSEGEQERFF